MNRLYYVFGIIILLSAVFLVYRGSFQSNEDFGGGKMDLISNSFENNGMIPSAYTCDGEEISPPLTISDVPSDAKSLVLIMDDPDAVKPAGKIWDHWVVFNIPPSIRDIAEGEEPPGIQGMTSFGRQGYGGPCPPDGEHSYIFRVYALDSELDLVEGATKDQVLQLMKDHILDEAELIGRYVKEE